MDASISTILYWSSLKLISQKPIGKSINKAWHNLVAYEVLIDIEHFVLLCMIMQKWVMQVNKWSEQLKWVTVYKWTLWFWVWSKLMVLSVQG